MTVAPNPDCRAGKHTACAGDAWDEQADAPGDCPCTCHTTTPAGRTRPASTPDRKVTGL